MPFVKKICLLLLCLQSSIFGALIDVTFSIDSLSGPPAQGAVVSFINNSTFETVSQTLDSEGKTSFNIPNGTYTFTTYLDNYVLDFASSFFSGNNGLGGYLTTTDAAISGKIKDAVTSNTISGADVTLFFNNVPIFLMTSNDVGEYSTPQLISDTKDLTTGNYSISAVTPLYQLSQSRTPIGYSNKTYNFSLTKNDGKISGKITIANSGLPIENALIQVQQNGIPISYATSDINGDYSIIGLGSYNYDLTITATGYKDSLTSASAILGDTVIFDSPLELSGGSINGLITNAYTTDPLSQIVVSLQLNGVTMQSTTTGDNGLYSFPGLGTNPYVILTHSDEYEGSYIKAKIEDTTPQTINLALGTNPGSLSGTVSGGGGDFSGATIQIKQDNIAVASFLTLNDNSFSYSGLSPGFYVIHASKNGYQSDQAQVTITGQDNTIVQLNLVLGEGKVSGKVTADGSGNDIQGAHVKITQDFLVIAEGISGADGTYILTGLPTGSYSINAGAAGFQFGVQDVSVTVGQTTTDTDFILESGGSAVNGRITDAITGLPIPGTVVKASDQGSDFFEYTVTQTNGDYSIRGLYSATFVVEAINSLYVNTSTPPFSIDADVTKDLSMYPVNVATNGLIGEALVNRALLQEDHIHKLWWEASSSPEVVSYRVYRNGSLVKSVPLTGPYYYEDHNRSATVADFYNIKSVNSDGSESAGGTIFLK